MSLGKHIGIKSIWLGVCATLIGVTAMAQDDTTSTFPSPRRITEFAEQKPHIGARAGIANPEQDYDGAFEYGIEAGFQPYVPFSVGLELTTFTSDNSDGADLDRTRLLLKAAYNMGGDLPVLKNSFVGAAVGPVFDTVGDTTRGRLGVGLLAGLDIPLSRSGQFLPESFSVGANANYLFVSNAAPDTFGLTGLVKYWF